MKKSKAHHPGHRSFFGYSILAAKGFCMGASDVVPGVSGGTMAFILGIYEDLINAIKSFDLKSLGLLMSFKFQLQLPTFAISSADLAISTARFRVSSAFFFSVMS